MVPVSDSFAPLVTRRLRTTPKMLRAARLLNPARRYAEVAVREPAARMTVEEQHHLEHAISGYYD